MSRTCPSPLGGSVSPLWGIWGFFSHNPSSVQSRFLFIRLCNRGITLRDGSCDRGVLACIATPYSTLRVLYFSCKACGYITEGNPLHLPANRTLSRFPKLQSGQQNMLPTTGVLKTPWRLYLAASWMSLGAIFWG